MFKYLSAADACVYQNGRFLRFDQIAIAAASARKRTKIKWHALSP